MHMDKALRGLEKLYGNCRKRNIELIWAKPTRFPEINLDLEKIETRKFEVTQILYNLYYLCLQENNELLKAQKKSF